MASSKKTYFLDDCDSWGFSLHSTYRFRRNSLVIVRGSIIIRYLIHFSFSLLLVFIPQVFAQEEESSCISCHREMGEDLAKPIELWQTKKEKRPVCTTCHTAHHQQRATLELINEKDCSRCHTYERARKIRFVMEETEGSLVQLDERIEKLRGEGFNTQRLGDALFANRNEFHRLTHVLSVDLIIDETETIRGDIKKVEKSVGSDEATIKRRKIGGAILIAFLLISAFIIHVYRKTLP